MPIVTQLSAFQKLISAFLREDQRVADAIDGVYRARFLDDATGAQLDGLGELVGAAREGSTDDQYRIRIRTQIRVNLSSGTVEDILSVFKAALPDSELRIDEYPERSAEFDAYLSPGVDDVTRDVLRILLRRAKAAGVRGLLHTTNDVGPIFRFAGGSGASRGFGVGKFASVG